MTAVMPLIAAWTTARLDRADAAHDEVLARGGRHPVRGVVDREDEELRSVEHHRALDLREGVLEADRRTERREALDPEGPRLRPRHPIDRDEGDLLDEPEARTPRHVLPEGHEVGLRVATHPLPRPVEQEDGGLLLPGGVAVDGADEGRDADLGDHALDRRERLGIARGRRIEGSLAPDDEVGTIGREFAVQDGVRAGDREILCLRPERAGAADVHLERGDLETRSVRGRERQERGTRDDEHHDRDGGHRAARPSLGEALDGN